MKRRRRCLVVVVQSKPCVVLGDVAGGSSATRVLRLSTSSLTLGEVSPHERTGARHGYETHDEPSRNSAIPLAVPHPGRRTGARHGYAAVTSA
jgi:hypothetical protein